MEANTVFSHTANHAKIEILADDLPQDLVHIRLTLGDRAATTHLDVFEATELSKLIVDDRLAAIHEYARAKAVYEGYEESQIPGPYPVYSHSSEADGSELKIFRVARYWMIEITGKEYRIEIPVTDAVLHRISLALYFATNAWAASRYKF